MKAFVIAVGVVNMTTGKTNHKDTRPEDEWSIYENQGLFGFLTSGRFLLFGTESTFNVGDNVDLVSNDGNRKLKSCNIIDKSSCDKDTLLTMLKKNNYDYYPIRAFKARPKNNGKLSTSYSVKGVE